MKTRMLTMLLTAGIGLAACSSSKQGSTGTDSMGAGDTSGNMRTDTSMSGKSTDTTAKDTAGTTTPRP